VKTTDAELASRSDGDGDRLGVVTKDGQIIYPDRQLMLLAKDVLSRNPGATVIYDVKSTQRLHRRSRAAGGVPMTYKTGHSLIKAKMAEIGAPIAGEMSGHIFFGERWYGFDDATLHRGETGSRSCRAARNPSAVLNGLADELQHAGVECALCRGRAPPPGDPSCRPALADGRLSFPGAGGQHHRWPAHRLARWLRPDPRFQHHARCWCCASRVIPPPRLHASRA